MLRPMSLNLAYFMHYILILVGAQIAASLAFPTVPLWYLPIGFGISVAIRQLSRTPASDFIVFVAALFYGMVAGFYIFDDRFLVWVALVAISILALFGAHLAATWLGNYAVSQRATIVTPLTIIAYQVLYGWLAWEYFTHIPWPLVRSIAGLALPQFLKLITLNFAAVTTYKMVYHFFPRLVPRQKFAVQMVMVFFHNWAYNFVLIAITNPELPKLTQAGLAVVFTVFSQAALLALSSNSRFS